MCIIIRMAAPIVVLHLSLALANIVTSAWAKTAPPSFLKTGYCFNITYSLNKLTNHVGGSFCPACPERRRGSRKRLCRNAERFNIYYASLRHLRCAARRVFADPPAWHWADTSQGRKGSLHAIDVQNDFKHPPYIMPTDTALCGALWGSGCDMHGRMQTPFPVLCVAPSDLW